MKWASYVPFYAEFVIILINFIITIRNKSINFGNALWWAEYNTYLDQEKADMRWY